MKSKPVKKATISPKKAKLSKPSPSKPASKSKDTKTKDTKAKASIPKDTKPKASKSKETKPKSAGSVSSKKGSKPSPAAKPKTETKVAKPLAKVSPKIATKDLASTPKLAKPKAKPKDKAKAKASSKAKPKKPGPSKSSEEQFGLEEFTISLTKPGESKEKIWRTKNFQQFPAQKDFGFPDIAPTLPTEYNEPKLVLMPKDPEYMFCYWEIPPRILVDREKEKIPSSNYQEALKINWEVKSLFEPNFTFVPVFFWAKKWYFGVPQVGQRYQVELGWLSDDGHFISILGSNPSELPESWANTQKRLSTQGDILAYSAKHTQILGSSENFTVEDFNTYSPEWNLSSESMTSSSVSKGQSQASALPQKASGSSRGRLEVSGKVIAGTQIQISGKPITVDKKGNFRIEFPYDQDILRLSLSSATGVSRSLTYDLKELVLS